MAILNVKRLNVLPGVLEASTLYIVKDASNADLVNLTFVGTSTTDVRHTFGAADTQSAIDAAVANLTAEQIPDLPGSKITSAVAEATHAVSADTATTATTATTADKLGPGATINGVLFTGAAPITISAEDTVTPRVAVSELGVTVATLVDGKIPVAQLPNGLDNIETFPSQTDFPVTGRIDTLYIAEDTNMMYRWSEGSGYIMIPAGGGVSDEAVKLATARQIALSGDASGSTMFDGSQNVTIAVALADVGTAGAQGGIVTTDAKGRVVSSRALAEGDIPDLPGTKITSAVAEAVFAQTAGALELGAADW